MIRPQSIDQRLTSARRPRFSRFQVSQLLGLDRWETERFLEERGAQRPYTLEDWELDRKSLEGLTSK